MISPPLAARVRGRLAVAFVGMLGLGACSLQFSGQATEYQLADSSSRLLANDAGAQEDLSRELERLFGSQAAPHLGENGTAQLGTLKDAAVLYARKCLHCHGNEGGGDGVTSRSLDPAPRDFRRGLFKYNNIANGGRPELADLQAVIRAGINGTGMPSMQGSSDAEIEGLAQYVRYLAMRGEVENWLVEEHEPGTPITARDAQQAFDDISDLWLTDIRERCVSPQEVPKATEASIRRGFDLFHDPRRANCAGCHGNGGRERGDAAWSFTTDSPNEKVALLRDAWGHESIPRRLGSEIFRHGDDPTAIFERIYLGIDGTPMAGIGAVLGMNGEALFSTDDLWALVHYVCALRDTHWQELTGALERGAQTSQ